MLDRTKLRGRVKTRIEFLLKSIMEKREKSNSHPDALLLGGIGHQRMAAGGRCPPQNGIYICIYIMSIEKNSDTRSKIGLLTLDIKNVGRHLLQQMLSKVAGSTHRWLTFVGLQITVQKTKFMVITRKKSNNDVTTTIEGDNVMAKSSL